MRRLIPGFELDEDDSEIRFSDMEIISTLSEKPPEDCAGIVFGQPEDGMLCVPSFGSLGASVLEFGGLTRVAAVASTDFRTGIVRAGEDPDSLGGGNTIVLMIDARMPRYSAARAMVTATEAVTAALRELGIGCRGCATATGSVEQNIVVVTPKESSITLSNAGKHSKLGELIGRATKEAVLQSSKLNGTAAGIHHVAKRLNIDIPDTKKNDRELEAVLMAILQLRDEASWGFIPAEVGLKAAKDVASTFSDRDYSCCNRIEEVASMLADCWQASDSRKERALLYEVL